MKVYRREGVARVRDQHTCFSDGTIADGDTLYEPRSAHLRRKFQKKESLFFFLFYLLKSIHENQETIFLLTLENPLRFELESLSNPLNSK